MGNYLQLSNLEPNKQGLNYEIKDFQKPNKLNEYNSSDQSLFTSILDENNSSLDFEIHECGAVDDNWENYIRGAIIDISDGNTKDGEIGDTKQGATGDCGLLSGVNALSYTEEGRKAIKSALDYQDGYTIVHTACGDYVVTDKEVSLTKADSQYSDGDDDMIIFELAIEKIIDDYANGKISIDENAHWLLKGSLEESPTSSGWSSTSGGWQAASIYFLTGKMSDVTKDHNIMLEYLNKFKENNRKDLALSASIYSENKGKTIKDVNGNELTLPANHGYAIKKFDGENVTVINPWDSSKEIVLPVEEFFKVFNHVQACDLSSNNPKQDFFSPKMYYNSQGLLEKSVERVDEENLTRTKSYTYDNDGNLTGTKSSFQYDSGFFGETVYDENASVISKKTGNKNTDALLTYEYDENGNAYNYQFGGVNGDGNLRYTFAEMTDEIGKRIAENYQLMTYQNLSAQDIFKLAKDLDDTQFNKALDYLKRNPNATYNNVKNNI